MKKLFKKGLPLFMAGLMFVFSVLPVAATVSENQTITTPSTGITQVYYNQESTFGITIPKLIDLGSDKETNYTVTITGDISSDETILVVPDESFLMKDTNTSSPKDDVTATVTQDKTEWKFNEFSTIGNGNVSAPDLTAGIWKGKFYFNVKLQDCKITVEAKNEAGEDINASATYITGSEKESLLDSLVDTGYISDASEVDALINVDSDDFDGIADTTFNVSDIAEEGDEVAILHYDEEKQIWEYIGTETVDENGLINGDFTSYSPVAFVKIDKNGNYTTQLLDAGLYDENDNLIYSWDELFANNILYMYDGGLCTNKPTELTGKLIVDKSIVEVGKHASASMESDVLTEVYLPNTITTINYRAFFAIDSLRKINLPSSLRYIGEGAFYKCDNLKEIIIEDGCSTVGYYSFANCNNLTNIAIPGSVTNIDGMAFYGCNNLKEVVIKEGVKTIGEQAFSACAIETLVIPKGVTTIGEYSFSTNRSLTQMYIPSSVNYIGKCAFSSCTSLKTVYYEGTEEQWNAITKGESWNSYWPSDVEIIYNYSE